MESVNVHELSIAQEILDIVNQYLPLQKADNIKTIKVKVGKLSNILPDSLSFCFEALVSGTHLQSAKLDIIEIPIKIFCTNCNTESEIDMPVFACPLCCSGQVKITSGTELQIDEIDFLDETGSN